MARSLMWLALLCASLTFAAGMRLELTHVDAREKYTVSERMRRATERTHRRLASMGKVTAPVHWAGSQYIASYLIGSPPQRAEAIIDTGSNLIWTQCAACSPDGCFAQNLPYYDPSASRTVAPVPCNATACGLGPETRCSRDGKSCIALTGYGGIGAIAGALGVETFTFGSENASLAFGCVAASKITPGALGGASGVIGLGRGALSLVSQLGDTKFAYCLTPYLSDNATTSHLLVGAAADGAGNASSSSPVTSVPLVKSPAEYPFSTYYYLPLSGISLGNATLDVPAAAFELRQVAPGSWAGTIIDSGSPFTALVDVAYRALRTELARQIGAGSLVPPPAVVLDLCVASGDLGTLVPPMVLHFGAAGDFIVPPQNYWLQLVTSTACMVVFSSAARPNATLPMNETTVIGNYMQQNVRMLYDLGNGVLSFQQADCSSV